MASHCWQHLAVGYWLLTVGLMHLRCKCASSSADQPNPGLDPFRVEFLHGFPKFHGIGTHLYHNILKDILLHTINQDLNALPNCNATRYRTAPKVPYAIFNTPRRRDRDWVWRWPCRQGSRRACHAVRVNRQGRRLIGFLCTHRNIVPTKRTFAPPSTLAHPHSPPTTKR